MTSIENKIIGCIDSETIDVNKALYINNCIIETIYFATTEFMDKVIISNCIIQEFDIHACWFKGGLLFANNIVKSEIDYQMGGHNEKEIEIIGNIFNSFFGSFDCHFEEKVIIENNIFMHDCDLLGKENEGSDNLFLKGYVANNNIGSLDKLELMPKD